jgi:hypothetical protein
VPVVKQHGKPVPNIVLINGQPSHSREGTFSLEWRENGERIQKPIGASPREALDAWRVKCGVLADPEASLAEGQSSDGRATIAAAIDTFLRDVKATKTDATHRAYSTDLTWFKLKITKHYVGTSGASVWARSPVFFSASVRQREIG